MKSLFPAVFFTFAIAASSALTAPTCEIHFSGCKTGAGYVSAEGRTLSACRWLKDLSQTLQDLQTVGACVPSPKTCAVETSGCKQGAAWISYNGQPLTACEWMSDFVNSYYYAASAGLCAVSSEQCSYKTSSACKDGAGIVYLGNRNVTGCQWLSDASNTIRALRSAGACQ